jgi:hypothetical protein
VTRQRRQEPGGFISLARMRPVGAEAVMPAGPLGLAHIREAVTAMADRRSILTRRSHNLATTRGLSDETLASGTCESAAQRV